jgi:hypothetical protein
MPVPISSLLELANNTDEQRFPILAKTPRAIRETLEFPYIYGAAFVQQFVNKTSWEKIADLYKSELIESTEQILHPEKAIQREHPIEVKIPDLSPQLGEGWRKSDVNVQGEYGYYQSLVEFLGKDKAQKGAAGWGGDQYMFYDHADNDNNILVQFSTWDTEKDAEEFFQAYIERTNKRYPKAKQIIDEKTPKIIIYGSDGEMLFIELRGQEVLSIEGATESQLKTIKEVLWKGSSKTADTKDAKKVIAKR